MSNKPSKEELDNMAKVGIKLIIIFLIIMTLIIIHPGVNI
jgi:hypothetical protein